MPIRISSVLGVSAEEFKATGAFNGFVDVDSRLHVDPHLLSSSTVPELALSRSRFDEHFRKILKLLTHSTQERDIFWNKAAALIESKEISQTGLGYAKNDTGGSGIGPVLAHRLTRIAKKITDAGSRDVEIFEILGLLQEDIGADRISDMTVAIILPELLSFSQRVAQQVQSGKVSFEYQDVVYAVPLNKRTGKPIVLVPRDILRKLPTALSWSDIDRVATHNESLRRRVNPIIGSTWKKATSAKIGKERLQRTLLENPSLIEELVGKYRAKPRIPYDFDRDPDVVFAWHDLAEALARENPLGRIQKRTDVVEVVQMICSKFKELVEANRLSRLLYNDDRTPRQEKIAQLAFFGVANAYCAANDLDITPEADGGAGPVDFKVSSGYVGRVIVEMKLSSNQKLLHGFEVQLPSYQRAEQAAHSVYLVVQNGPRDARIRQLLKARDEAVKKKLRVPEVVIVDGRLQASASKRTH